MDRVCDLSHLWPAYLYFLSTELSLTHCYANSVFYFSVIYFKLVSLYHR